MDAASTSLSLGEFYPRDAKVRLVLERLRVQNFRLLRDVTIEFEPAAPTVFIGPNGSGKSTVLEVLDFLGRCSTEGVQAAAQAHGGLGNLRTAGASGPISLEMEWLFRAQEGEGVEARAWGLRWSFSLLPAKNGGVIVQREELVDASSKKPRPLITTDDGGGRQVWPEHSPKGEPSSVASAAKLAFEEISDPARFPGLNFLQAVTGGSQIIGAISTAPAWARAEASHPSPRDSLVIGPQPLLDRQGLGLANVLFTIFNEHAEAWRDLEAAFRAEFPFVRRLVFPPDVGGAKITFAFEDIRFNGRKFFAAEMSDGMIAYLCLLASMLQPAQTGILGLDEPDANLHPSALRRLMALAHRPHDRRGLAIVTHSNALLDELREPADSIRIVESTKGGAQIRKLDVGALEAWRQDYTLSDLRRTGLLDPANTADGADE
jgi:predicted ATPase